eukprot:917111-Amphidinium_carterae.2
MPEHVKHIMKGKRLLLFQFLLKGAGFEDSEMMRGLKRGFPLVGELPSAGWFPRRAEGVETVKLADLLKESTWRIPRLEASCKPSGDAMEEDELRKKCDEEVAKGRSAGPYSRDEVNRIHGEGKWVAAKRFAIWQSSSGQRKLRVIDDYSIAGQNGTVVAAEKLDHAGLDEVVAIVRCMGSAIECGKADVTDVHGQCRTGRTSVLSELALPFGATGSVYEFNSVARALEVIVCHWAGVVTSSFFDDYSLVEPAVTSDSATKAVESLGMALRFGWSEIRVADLVVANTDRRKQQILEEIDGITAKEKWNSSEAAKLAGRLNFCRAFVSGRHLNITLWDVFQRAAGDTRTTPITRSEKKALQIIREYVCKAGPRVLQFSPDQKVVLLYTDGAIEENFAGAGAVLCLPDKEQPVRVMSVVIPEHLIARWSSRSRHAVAEAEMLPAVLAGPLGVSNCAAAV